MILSRTSAKILACALLLLTLGVACRSQAASRPDASSNVVKVVAAENFYGDIAQQLGGPAVSVTSIINDPNADPHEYESSSENARAIAAARLVIVNGSGYDTFMDKLLAASPSKDRIVLSAADVLGKKEGDNPHVWYNVSGMQQLADRITQALQQLDPAESDAYAMRNMRFKSSLQPLLDRMNEIKSRYSGTHLTQTEPVFGYMGTALGLMIDDGEFQHAIEEGNDPSPQSVAQIRQEIMSRSVKALLYNSQTTNSTTDSLKNLAKQNNVPIVGVSETEPPKQTYQVWMLSQLSALQMALAS